MTLSPREYPPSPVLGIGGVVIDQGRVLLVRRANEPLRGQWSIPGGKLELGETLQEGVVRELLQETGLEVRVLDLIEIFEHIDSGTQAGAAPGKTGPRFHYVIADYLCERVAGEPQAASDVTDVIFAREDELQNFALTPVAQRVLRKAFAMNRRRRQT